MAILTKQFDFEPLLGVAPLRFGMSREEAYAALQVQPAWVNPGFAREKVTREGFSSFSPTLAVTFNEDGKIESIEVIGSAGLMWDGIDLFALDANELRSRLESRKLSTRKNGDGYRCDEIGLAVDSPDLGAGRRRPRIRSLMAYPPGYWDFEVGKIV
jgi:hypothetical protein